MNISSGSLPALHTKGFWSFKEPFSRTIPQRYSINPATMPLTLIGITSFNELINNSQIDPLTVIYIPSGLTEVDYKRDVANQVEILVLECRGKDPFVRVMVPLKYVASVPNISLVPYLETSWVLRLGDLPEGIDLTPYHADIKEFVHQFVGVMPEIIQVQYSEPQMLSMSEHEMAEQVRLGKAVSTQTTLTKYNALKVEYDQLKDDYDRLLECFENLQNVP